MLHISLTISIYNIYSTRMTSSTVRESLDPIQYEDLGWYSSITLCQACANIFCGDKASKNNHFLAHHATLVNFYSAYKQKCPICVVAWGSMKEHNKRWTKERIISTDRNLAHSHIHSITYSGDHDMSFSRFIMKLSLLKLKPLKLQNSPYILLKVLRCPNPRK